MRYVAVTLALVALFSSPLRGEEKREEARIVDLAICLDTSGSMSGLINAARERIWAIVNDLALAKPTPRLRVALVTFGNNGNDAGLGWVRIETGLTEDLDLVSQKLFALSTSGGTEYVGRVLDRALKGLAWQPGTDALKLIVVAGNESADQDRVISFRDACKRLITRGIMVNSIYCGNAADNLAPAWREVAKLADGQFAAIDQNHGTVQIATPFDDDLERLSRSLNATYIPIGAAGRAGILNQIAQDKNAAGLSLETAARRGQSKASGIYVCGWCLVDATRNKSVKLVDVKDEDLPVEMRGWTMLKKQQHIDTTYAKRVEIQKQIQELNKKRQQYVRKEMAKKDASDDQAFDRAVRDALRSQAKKKGYRFEE